MNPASTPEFTRKVTPVFKMTAALPFKIIGGAILLLLGTYYLASGKEEGNAQKMVLGALLTILSFFIF